MTTVYLEKFLNDVDLFQHRKPCSQGKIRVQNHIVWIPKYRNKILKGKLAKDV